MREDQKREPHSAGQRSAHDLHHLGPGIAAGVVLHDQEAVPRIGHSGGRAAAPSAAGTYGRIAFQYRADPLQTSFSEACIIGHHCRHSLRARFPNDGTLVPETKDKDENQRRHASQRKGSHQHTFCVSFIGWQTRMLAASNYDRVEGSRLHPNE